jgi:hypothetical protein
MNTVFVFISANKVSVFISADKIKTKRHTYMYYSNTDGSGRVNYTGPVVMGDAYIYLNRTEYSCYDYSVYNFKFKYVRKIPSIS